MRKVAPAIAAGLGLALAACSADSVTAPEPAIEQPGSFVVATDDAGVIFLVRTLRAIPFGSDSILDIILYQGSPASYAEAKRWAQDPSLPITDASASISLRVLDTLDPEVVWFRTLEQSELDELLP